MVYYIELIVILILFEFRRRYVLYNVCEMNYANLKAYPLSREGQHDFDVRIDLSHLTFSSVIMYSHIREGRFGSRNRNYIILFKSLYPHNEKPAYLRIFIFLCYILCLPVSTHGIVVCKFHLIHIWLSVS